MRSSTQGAVMAAACQDVSISYALVPSSALIHWHIQLQKGADGARGDDANTVAQKTVRMFGYFSLKSIAPHTS
jgi:hypothetical protein